MAQSGPNLKDLRQRRRLSLREASGEMGVAVSVLHRAERGGIVSLSNAVKIAGYYGVAVADLIPAEQAA